MRHNILLNDTTGYYQLQEYIGPNPGYRKEILDRIKERLDFTLACHSQVMTVPMVIRFPEGLQSTPDNNCFQYFIEEYRRRLSKHGFGPHYVWVTEQNLSCNRHYHLIWFQDHQKTGAVALVNTFSGFAGFFTTLALSPLVAYIQNNGNMIFGISIQAQQLLSVFSLVFTIVILIYLFTVISKIPSKREHEIE